MFHEQILTPLEPCSETAVPKKLQKLPAQFRISRLIDRPQDPIMEFLHSKRTLIGSSQSIESRPTEVSPFIDIEYQRIDEDLWGKALRYGGEPRSHLLSWDTLRANVSARSYPTPFLSEQPSIVFAAARHIAVPQIHVAEVSVRYVTQDELLESLKLTVLGTSSNLYVWDPDAEAFIAKSATSCRVLVDGKDDKSSESVIRRFLIIGMLMRRLENLISTLRSKSSRDGPTIHALTHSLASILTHLRDDLVAAPICAPCTKGVMLTSIWASYAKFENTLIALAAFCGRDPEKRPEDYAPLDTAPANLLSRLYFHLNLHIERCSPPHVTGIFAYLLMKASRDYLQRLCASLSFGGDVRSLRSSDKDTNNRLGVAEDEDDNDEEDVVGEKIDTEPCPNFFPPSLVDALPAAKRSLQLLLLAQPDHPLLTSIRGHREIVWFWTEEATNAAWIYDQYPAPPKEVGYFRSQETVGLPQTVLNGHDLKRQFGIFDLEPGTHVRGTSPDEPSTNATAVELRVFLGAFPETLPSSTPTLSQLVDLVFRPLTEHVNTLSASLLNIFLSPTSHLNLREHLILLRSYLLLTSPSFKSKLASALFSDTPDRALANNGVKTFLGARHSSQELAGVANLGPGGKPWAIGLAFSLTERDSWPPGGADLSFLLRTVIVDSLERREERGEKRLGDESHRAGRDRVLEEAEFRLGFAIRDLPTGPGRDKWLNPLSIEALDFLYMDYKTPLPLAVLITPDILSKYQRMFTFLLRMMRVENVTRTVMRMTMLAPEPLFPTLTYANALLLHFRFIASTFVHALTEYVFDTAIGANFDAFLSRLSPEAQSQHDSGAFDDVYALATCHSAVLDDILSACLLRSGQRTVGDLLRGALEVLLDFGILVGQLHLGQLSELDAASRLELLFGAFRGKMLTMVKVLQAFVELNSGSATQREHSSIGRDARIPPGGTASLHHFLLRLDTSDWWTAWDNVESSLVKV